MTATQTPVMGQVAGFILVIDPQNVKGMHERVEFEDAIAMSRRSSEITRSDDRERELVGSDYWPTDQDFFTKILLDNGTTEEIEGCEVSGNTKIGQRRIKLFCDCGASAWFVYRENTPRGANDYVCDNCSRKDDDRPFDLDQYDGSEERER